MTMARPARVLPSCSPYKPASGSTGGFSFGGCELHQFTSSIRPQRLPISPAHIHRHSWLRSKRGSTGICMERDHQGRDITARGTGRLAAPVSGIRTPECLPWPTLGRHTQRVMLRGYTTSPATQGSGRFAPLSSSRSQAPLQHAPTKKPRQSPKLWRGFACPEWR